VRPSNTIVALVLVAGTLAVYAPVVQFGFLEYDDFQYVAANPHVAAGLTVDGARWALTSFYASNWHPLTWLSHMLDVQLFGMSPGAHHAVNVLFHIAAAIVLLRALARATGNVGASALVAMLFAWHPLHVESVAWIAERKDVLSGFFWMLAIDAYLRFGGDPARRRDFVLAGLWFALGLAAKPMVVTLPLVLLLLDFWPLGRLPTARAATERVREKLPFLALSIAGGLATIQAQSAGGALPPLEAVPIGDRLSNAAVSSVLYLARAVWPAGLALFYPRTPVPLAQAAGALALLATITVAAVRTAGSRPWLAVGWLWYLVTLAPVIGVVQVGDQAMADRYTYIPLVGVFLIAAWGLPDLAAILRLPRAVASVGVAVALVALLVVTRRQVSFWRTSDTLFARALAVTRDNYVAHFNLATAAADRGAVDEAIEHLREVVRIAPRLATARFDLGVLLARRGDAAAAASELEAALRLRPSAAAHLSLADVLAGEGKIDDAIPHYAEAARLAPRAANVEARWAAALAAAGRHDEAITHSRAARRLGD